MIAGPLLLERSVAVRGPDLVRTVFFQLEDSVKTVGSRLWWAGSSVFSPLRAAAGQIVVLMVLSTFLGALPPRYSVECRIITPRVGRPDFLLDLPCQAEPLALRVQLALRDCRRSPCVSSSGSGIVAAAGEAVPW